MWEQTQFSSQSKKIQTIKWSRRLLNMNRWARHWIEDRAKKGKRERDREREIKKKRAEERKRIVEERKSERERKKKEWVEKKTLSGWEFPLSREPQRR